MLNKEVVSQNSRVLEWYYINKTLISTKTVNMILESMFRHMTSQLPAPQMKLILWIAYIYSQYTRQSWIVAFDYNSCNHSLMPHINYNYTGCINLAQMLADSDGSRFETYITSQCHSIWLHLDCWSVNNKQEPKL